ncbi:retrovirus-related pol polyprotein from transposon TNT 1-94 [Tanacetum coccineum]
MASHRSKSLYTIKECSTCGSLYTRDCCSIGSLEDKILTPVPDSSPCCAKCGTPVDGPYCRGCALLRKKCKEDLLTYCVENEIFQDSQDTFESSDDNTDDKNQRILFEPCMSIRRYGPCMYVSAALWMTISVKLKLYPISFFILNRLVKHDTGCDRMCIGEGKLGLRMMSRLSLKNDMPLQDKKNGLYVMKLGNKSQDKLCLATVVDNSTLWHRRLGHANMRLIQSLSSKELVRNLPKLKYDKHFCDACKIGKQAHASHKAKNMVSTKRCLELLHMDLFGPSAIKSYGGNLYTLVVVDDYSRYTWTRFLKTKNEAFEKFEILSRKIQNQLGSSIIAIRTDHGREFDNEVQFGAYCDAQGITHNFSAPRTPQSNRVVERKNKTLQEMSRTMLNEQFIPQKFWCNAVDTSTYILNRILIRPILGKTPYEIFRGRKPSLEYFKVFGSKCFILNTKDYLTKFDPKSYEGVFLGYSQNSKAYVVLNKHTMKVEESLNVTFDESPPPTKLSPLVDDDVGEEEAIKKNTKVVNNNNEEEDESIEVDEIVNIKESKNHPLDQVIGNLNQRTLRLESIRILLAIACADDFKLYQMDVKSVFLNGFIIEEVYVAQPPRFIDFQKPNYVYKLKKALYGLKQATKACVVWARLGVVYRSFEEKVGKA